MIRHLPEPAEHLVQAALVLLEEEGVIYGVTTGYGDSCTVNIPLSLVDELPLHLTRFHGCGMGEYLSEAETRGLFFASQKSMHC